MGIKTSTILTAAMLLASHPLSIAETFVVDGLTFNSISSTEAEIIAGEAKYSGAITVPAQVSNGSTTYTVTAVGADAFKGCAQWGNDDNAYGLTSVVLPSTIRTIGDNAFSDSWLLKSVNLPEGLESIGASAFNSCENLESVSIPGTVVSIGINTFQWCSGMTSATLSNGITAIPDNMFRGCSSLVVLNLPSTLKTVGVKSITYKGETLEFPEGLEQIAEDGITAYNLSTLILPSTLKSIGGYAFSNSSNLTSVTCHAIVPPVSVSSVFPRSIYAKSTLFVSAEAKEAYTAAAGWKEFANINAEGETPVETVEVKIGNLWYLLKKDGLTATVIAPTEEGESYSGDIIVPASVNYESADYAVTSLGDDCFGSSDITKITLSEGLKSIGKRVFSYCGKIRKIAIPASVGALGDNAFAYCDNLFEVSFAENSQIEAFPSGLFKGDSQLYEAVFPVGIKTIGSEAYSGTGISSLPIPGTVTEIGSGAFKSCRSLTSVSIPSSVTSLGDNAFFFTPITTVEIPASVGIIPEDCFRACDKLETVIISDGITAIGNGAFASCTVLESIKIPESVKSIGEEAFQLDSKLGDIDFGPGVESIGYRAFYYCDGIGILTLPASMKEIGEQAFANCTALTAIESKATVPPTAYENSFDIDTYQSATLKVNDNVLEAYKAASPWNLFVSIGVQTGIDDIAADDSRIVRIYRLDGTQLEPNHAASVGSGVYVVHFSNGSIKKMVVR